VSCVLKEAASTAIDSESSTADVQPSYTAAVTSSELSVDDLLSLSAAELNCRLELLSPAERFHLKKLRRTLKNRHYNETFRIRRLLKKYAFQHTSDVPVAEIEVSILCRSLLPSSISYYILAYYYIFSTTSYLNGTV